MSTEEEEARKIAEMGKPVLGEHSRLEVVIEESYEFKVSHLKTLEIVSPYFIFIFFNFTLFYQGVILIYCNVSKYIIFILFLKHFI